MNAYTIVALALIVLGVLGLIFGQFGFTKETNEAQIGPVELSVTERKTVDIPQWVGAAAILAGAGLLFIGARLKSGVGV